MGAVRGFRILHSRAAAAGLWLDRQPLLVAAACLLSGIACGYQGGAWGLAAAAALLCTGAAAFTRAPLRSALVALCLLMAGWALAARDRAGRDDEARRFRALVQPQTYVCRVGPEVTVLPLHGRAAKHTFRAEGLRTADGTLACRHLPVEVAWFGSVEEGAGATPQPGETWRLRGAARVRKGRDGLPLLAINSGEERATRQAAISPSAWRARVANARRAATRRVVIGIETWGDIPALNQAMLLGSRHALPPALRRVFVDSGTIHVFAISGLHIVLVAAVLSLAVAVCGVPRTYWVLAIGPPLIFYTALTGARPSAVRACLMALLYLVAPLLGRRPNGLTALAGTALIVYALRPALLFDIGCVLSFTVMGGLVVFCRPFCQAGQRVCRVARLTERANLARAAGKMAHARRLQMLAHAVTWVADSFAVSLAAWLASVPLTAHYFGRFTPGGLFANLVVGPCSFFIVVAGCLGMAASVASDWVAGCFNHAAGCFTWVMVKAAQATAACPGANLRIAPWPLWLVWLWFGALLALAVWLRTRRPDGLAWLPEIHRS
ncbi:MAG: ComEC/Rec2 family competence protein [Kiritimatiellia bacterium]|jgi:ComEC/Rec2-related protein|nr:ComEC/Rec2 family competence protein [Kiritimatiellia bacterium]MDD4173622.1 ComEC/Rec2 family competence protein [Kiritimatiellia bacterium]MDX9794102.1 ComEC/Rec2 family competence protein [Kiritimatiellia bacterium]